MKNFNKWKNLKIFYKKNKSYIIVNSQHPLKKILNQINIKNFQKILNFNKDFKTIRRRKKQKLSPDLKNFININNNSTVLGKMSDGQNSN